MQVRKQSEKGMMATNTAKNKLKKEIAKFHYEAKKKGINSEELRRVLFDSRNCDNGDKDDTTTETSRTSNGSDLSSKQPRAWILTISRHFTKNVFAAIFAVGVISAILFTFVFGTNLPKCVLENNEISIEMTRPLVHCGLCRNMYSVPVEHAISEEDFRMKYAYSSVPVLIKDATSHWTAMSNFSFKYFKEVYQGTEGALKAVDEECQFFPYKTEFSSLGDVFNMTEARANFEDGEKPWYIGWSNCHKEVKEELRKHYERPYFLPTDSESSNLDWIFMGGSGPGALVHIDYVQKPSWQAQISGKKSWSLIPPPECETECIPLNVTVHKGDIIVVDTNLWYHSTFVHPGEISITIGSEFD